MKLLKGSELSKDDQVYVLGAFIYRHTGDHRAAWMCKKVADGEQDEPLQFASDKDWLENTEFEVNKNNKFKKMMGKCFSNPTWPDNPELRKN